MRKYKVKVDYTTISGKGFTSYSRNSKELLRRFGGNRCEVYTMKGKLISLATRDENGKIHNGYIGKGE